jgi:8-hydroxy-5-deazaflavin:NADPH oxidoreductase
LDGLRIPRWPAGAVRVRVGILGAGNVGSALANLWMHHNHEIIFGSREPGAEGPIRPENMEEASRFGEVVVAALPWQAAYNLLPSLDLADKTVIDDESAPHLR